MAGLIRRLSENGADSSTIGPTQNVFTGRGVFCGDDGRRFDQPTDQEFHTALNVRRLFSLGHHHPIAGLFWLSDQHGPILWAVWAHGARWNSLEVSNVNDASGGHSQFNSVWRPNLRSRKATRGAKRGGVRKAFAACWSERCGGKFVQSTNKLRVCGRHDASEFRWTGTSWKTESRLAPVRAIVPRGGDSQENGKQLGETTCTATERMRNKHGATTMKMIGRVESSRVDLKKMQSFRFLEGFLSENWKIIWRPRTNASNAALLCDGEASAAEAYGAVKWNCHRRRDWLYTGNRKAQE